MPERLELMPERLKLMQMRMMVRAKRRNASTMIISMKLIRMLPGAHVARW